MVATVAGVPRPSASSVERTLAALLVGLLGLYVVGTFAGGVAPVVGTAGVVAVHLALVVGFAFPLAVVGRAVYLSADSDESSPRLREVVTAVIALGTFVAALWFATDPAATLDTPLLATAAGSLFVLVGLVAGRP